VNLVSRRLNMVNIRLNKKNSKLSIVPYTTKTENTEDGPPFMD